MKILPADEIALDAIMAEISRRVKAAEAETDIERLAYRAGAIRDAATKLQSLANVVVSEARARAQSKDAA